MRRLRSIVVVGSAAIALGLVSPAATASTGAPSSDIVSTCCNTPHLDGDITETVIEDSGIRLKGWVRDYNNPSDPLDWIQVYGYTNDTLTDWESVTPDGTFDVLVPYPQKHGYFKACVKAYSNGVHREIDCVPWIH